MPEHAEKFASLVHLILTVEKPKGKEIKTVARKMGVEESTLRSRIRTDGQRTKFTVDEIKNLIAVMDDVRLIDFFLEGTGLIVAKRTATSKQEKKLDTKSAIRDGADETVLETTDILEAVLAALKDDKLCHNDKNSIAKEIEDAERALVALRNQLS